MATGYIVSGRGDLDAIFLPRTSAAIANTGFRSNGAVDLAQRFEPRAGSTPVANTNFKAGANDLASLFMDIALATTSVTYTMTAGASGSQYRGYQGAPAFDPVFGSISGNAVGTRQINGIYADAVHPSTGIPTDCFIFSQAGATAPPDTNATWQKIEVTGNFGSGVQTFTHFRGVVFATWSSGGRTYNQYASIPIQGTYVNGNAYTVKIFYLP